MFVVRVRYNHVLSVEAIKNQLVPGLQRAGPIQQYRRQ